VCVCVCVCLIMWTRSLKNEAASASWDVAQKKMLILQLTIELYEENCIQEKINENK